MGPPKKRSQRRQTLSLQNTNSSRTDAMDNSILTSTFTPTPAKRPVHPSRQASCSAGSERQAETQELQMDLDQRVGVNSKETSSQEVTIDSLTNKVLGKLENRRKRHHDHFSRSTPSYSEITAQRTDVKMTSATSRSGTFHCKFSVRTTSDKRTTWINRMISMPDGRICVVVRGDYKIKLYTDNYVLCDEVRVLECRAVTCMYDDTVAIATRHDITRYSVKGNKITQTGRTLHIDGDIYDIAYRRGEFITRCRKHNTDYTYCGRKLIVKQDRDMSLSDCVHNDPISNCVILGNSEEHTVTCYTLNGDVKWRVTLDGKPTGMVVVHGVVLVADYDNNTIREITMDGRLLSTPLLTKSQVITYPRAITYQHKQHRLLVTSKRDEDVMVFNVTQ